MTQVAGPVVVEAAQAAAATVFGPLSLLEWSPLVSSDRGLGPSARAGHRRRRPIGRRHGGGARRSALRDLADEALPARGPARHRSRLGTRTLPLAPAWR